MIGLHHPGGSCHPGAPPPLFRSSFLYILVTALCAALILSACQPESASPEQTVEAYLQAKVRGEQDTLRRLLCLEMEDRLQGEAAAFASVSEARIEGLACQPAGEPGRVICQGKILAAYGDEQTEFPLGTYQLVEEDGQWKWCGETN